MAVEGRGAQANPVCQLLDSQRPVEIVLQPVDGAGDLVGVVSGGGDLAQARTLLAVQQPVSDLLLHQRRQRSDIVRMVEQTDEPLEGVEQRR